MSSFSIKLTFLASGCYVPYVGIFLECVFFDHREAVGEEVEFGRHMLLREAEFRAMITVCDPQICALLRELGIL